MADQYYTQFAPPDRDPLEQIQAQSGKLHDMALMRAMLNSVPEVFVVVNAKRQIVLANTVLSQMLGLETSQALLGQRPGEAIHCVHAHENEAGCGTAEACQTCGAIAAVLIGMQGRETVRESRITREDGQVMDLRVWVTPLIVDDEPYCVVFLKDIADEKRRQVLERIFFHDVLNTAGLVSSYAQLLELEIGKGNDLVKEMVSVSNQLIGELQEQKDLLAAENGTLKLKLSSINSGGLARELAIEYRHSSHAANKTLAVTSQASATFDTDPVLLRRVLGNMLLNALEASAEGDTVSLCCDVNDHEVLFAVNNPSFMPRRVQLQIFQRSFSTKDDGRGLGTYSIKLLTENYLDGRVWFTSDKSAGTTFYIALPLCN